MVDPVSDADRISRYRQLKLAFVALVALSAGLVAHQGGATPLESALVVLVGGVVGAALAWFVFPGNGASLSSRRGR